VEVHKGSSLMLFFCFNCRLRHHRHYATWLITINFFHTPHYLARGIFHPAINHD
jgi:hypothetical protein